MHPDDGEPIGWHDIVAPVADVYQAHPAGTPILSENYGEAGASDRCGPGRGRPPAYSGHNGFGYWGRPRDDNARVVVVGYSPQTAKRYLDGCTIAARVHN